MRATIMGELRQVEQDRGNADFIAVAILPPAGLASVRGWCFQNTEGLADLVVGDQVEADVYVKASSRKDGRGEPFLNVQVRSLRRAAAPALV